MKYALWSLITIDSEQPESPALSLHATYREAVAELLNMYGHELKNYSDDDLGLIGGLPNEQKIRAALDDIVDFTIDTAIIDTDELGEGIYQ